jgi:hypothetical protein
VEPEFVVIDKSHMRQTSYGVTFGQEGILVIGETARIIDGFHRQEPMSRRLQIGFACSFCLSPSETGVLIILRGPATIVSLLFGGGPSNISDFVVTIRINAIQRHIWRSVTNGIK